MGQTDWDIILDRFNYNASAIAQAIHDIQGVRKNFNISRIRNDIEHQRFNQYTGVVLSMLELQQDKIERYQKENPKIINSVDIGIAVKKTIEALEPVTDKDTVRALIAADDDIEHLINLVFLKLGGGKEWFKVLRGDIKR
jgi:hypothetical protein